MFSVVFKVGWRYFNWIEKKRVYSLKEAQNLLFSSEQKAEEGNKHVPLTFIIQKNNQSVFQDEIVLGDGQPKNIVDIVQQTLETSFLDLPKKEREEFVNAVSSELEKEKQKENFTLSIGLEPKEEKEILKQPQASTRSKRKERKPHRLTKLKRRLPSKKQTSIFIFLLSAFLIVGVGSKFLPKDLFQKKEPVLTLTDYLSEKNYEEAFALYPESEEKIKETMIEQNDFEELREWNTKKPTPETTFDLAFYDEDWEKVIQSDAGTLNKERRVMLAHSFIQLGQLEEAEILNEELESETLAEEIKQAYFKKAIQWIQKGHIKKAEEIQEKIKEDDLAELIAEGKAYTKLIKHYEAKKDKESVADWQNILKNVGKEVLEDDE